MKRILLAVFLILVGGVIVYFWKSAPQAPKTIDSFEACVQAGNPVMESYPAQCRTKDGALFVQDIGNELEKDDVIRVNLPRPNALVTSPLTISGQARGTWFFEASFPARLLDENGSVVGEAIVEAKSDWMTEDFVPFEATVEFSQPTGTKGTLILEKSNASGLPENADELRIPVIFTR